MNTQQPQDLYRQKLCSAEQALAQISNGDFIVAPTGVGEPPALLTALSEHRRRFQGVTVAQILAVRKYGYFDPETAANVRHVSFFFGVASRAGGQCGQIDFIPSYFSEMPMLFERGLIP